MQFYPSQEASQNVKCPYMSKKFAGMNMEVPSLKKSERMYSSDCYIFAF